MKTGGLILLIFGVMAVLGNFIGEGNPTGGVLLAVIGAYMLHVHNRRQREKEEKEKWERDK